jgi:hypothetical protein
MTRNLNDIGNSHRLKKNEKKETHHPSRNSRPDNQNVMMVGPRSPMLMQNVWFQEKLAHFDRAVCPLRDQVLMGPLQLLMTSPVTRKPKYSQE